MTLLQQTAEELTAELARHRTTLGNEDDNLAVYVDALIGELRHLAELTGQAEDHLKRRKSNTDLAGQLLACAQATQGAGELLIQALDSHVASAARTPGQTFQKACNWVTSKLPGWLSGIWNSVWAMIQRLATPRSWTISGGITAPSLGLTSASISITFG